MGYQLSGIPQVQSKRSGVRINCAGRIEFKTVALPEMIVAEDADGGISIKKNEPIANEDDERLIRMMYSMRRPNTAMLMESGWTASKTL